LQAAAKERASSVAFQNFEEFWAALDRLYFDIMRTQELQQKTAEQLERSVKRMRESRDVSDRLAELRHLLPPGQELFTLNEGDISQRLDQLAGTLAAPHSVLVHKYYVDELYDATIVHPIEWISTNVLWKGVDDAGIDGAVNGVASIARDAGQEARQVQSGNGRTYASWLVAGAAAVVILFLWLGQ
jgi:hypothetical protein